MALAYINIMKKAANKAAFGVMRDFCEVEKLQVSKKGLHNFVTSADIMAEKQIVNTLLHYYPDSSIICEESGEKKNEKSELTWIIDPIDGTNNFMRGIPYFSISIAAKVRDRIEAALVLDPVRGEYFMAERGNGAFVNRTRLRVSARDDLSDAMVAIHCNNKLSENLSKLAIIRRMGTVTLDLAYLAAGKYDVVVCNNVSLWDVVQGVLLIQESGGFVTQEQNTDGTFNIIAAASNRLLHEIKNILEK